MIEPPSSKSWTGRVDDGGSLAAGRWHQRIQLGAADGDLGGAPVLIGFACDVGVRRNQGRAGAAAGPAAIRRSLGNLAFPPSQRAFDLGDVVAVGDELEAAQDELAGLVAWVLERGGSPLVLGGGHEVAWGSHQGLLRSLAAATAARVGVVNFDAHFDLRDPRPTPGSGSPFRQIAERCADDARPFEYKVIGVNPSANTSALFDYARSQNVSWHSDVECCDRYFERLMDQLEAFVRRVTHLHVSVCLDVFPACRAPGVSAPAALGVEPAFVIRCLRELRTLAERHGVRWALAEVAELNPSFDEAHRTAALAARLVHELAF